MLLLDLTHTSHTHARTGVQRVARSLFAALIRRAATEPVTHDRFRGAWRRLAAWEERQLADHRAARRRGAHWPWHARWHGRLRRVLKRPSPPLPMADEGIVLPEIFSPEVAAALPSLFAQGRPRVALFHDAIAMRLPEHTPAKTVARFPTYLQELRTFDGIAAVSADSQAALLDYWAWLGWRQLPPVVTLPLGLDPLPSAAASEGLQPRATDAPVVLTVGSVEGRKNHLALLEACESLWSEGVAFSLHIVGLPRLETARPALDRMRALQQRGRPLRFDGPVDDAALNRAYAACSFTVYPSLMEGFGLPVLESLQHGRPCVCSARGALGESAEGGGCLALPEVDAPALATAMRRLLSQPAERERLAVEAAARRFRSWDDYTDDLLAWMRELPLH